MLKREMKINFKNFIIWLFVLILLFLVVFLIYPFIIDSENFQAIDEMMQMFPQEILIAFNMDISSINSAYGWLKTEGFVFVLLIIGCYSGILGSQILLKEENDKTIEYLNSLPVKRNDIIISKMLAGFIYITLLTVILGLFNLIALSLSQEFDIQQYILLSITPLFSSYVIYCLCLFLSTLTHKTKKMFGISLGIVMLSYVLQMISSIAKVTEFLKYFSVFTLSDIRNVIVNVEINPVMILICICLSTLFIVFTFINYNRKELL